MSKLKYVSEEVKSDGRSGFKVQYEGRQLLTMATKTEAHTFITKHLRKVGEFGPEEKAPVKAKFRMKATKPSNICGIVFKPAQGFYEGSSFNIGRHSDIKNAKAALDRELKKRQGDDARRLGSEVVVKKSPEETLKRWRFLTEYGEPPAKKKP